MNLYRDIFNRKIQVGDLLLVNTKHTKVTQTHLLCLVKVNEDYGLEVVSPVLKECYNDDNIFDCYKIKDSTGDILSIYESGYISPVLLGTKNMWDDDCITDILGRPVHAGDFIMYLDSYSKLVFNHVKYGIVIDSKHIFNENSTISKVNHVFKIQDRNSIEEPIYNRLISEYKQFQYLQINKVNKELECGDVYRTNNNMYIYVGEYTFNVLADNPNLHFTKRIEDLVLKKHKVYLKLNLNVKKAVNLYNSLKTYQCSQEQINKYISTSGISNYAMYLFGMPNVYEFDITDRRRGMYLDSVYFPYSIDSYYTNKKSIEVYYTFF